jgi:hypothetical protein
MLGVALEQIGAALCEIEAACVEDEQSGRRPARKMSPIVQAMRAQAGQLAIAPGPRKALKVAEPDPADGHVVLVCIDGRPPRLALVVDEDPKPGFKTIRLQDGRSSTKFSRKEHRVLDSEIRRDATADERAHGLGGRLKAVRGAA